MIGQTISHYKITAKLGEGGMGVVYRAEDLKLGRAVALKFLPAHLLDSAEHKARFLHEARAAAALDHPNICTVYEIDEAVGKAFLAMACLEGQTLKQKIAERPLPLQEALDSAIQVGHGLQAAHEKGVVHRDIKPANIMITSQGQVKIMDFGLAQLTGGTRLTKTDTVMGTPAYMSPEQAQRLPTDRRTDIWSLGVVLYEMVTGRLPFEGEREAAVVHSIINEPHEPITAVRVGVPTELDRIAGKALAKKPEERYQHLEDMLVDLQSLRNNLGAQRATRARAPARPLLRRLWVALLLLALVVAGYFTWEATRAPEAPPRVTRFAIVLPAAHRMPIPENDRELAVSPVGRYIAFRVGGRAGGSLAVRSLDRMEVHLFSDITAARSPFFSPDSRWIGFSERGQLKRVSVAGGAPIVIGNNLGGGSASWADDNTIVYTRNGRLLAVSANGGEPTLLAAPDGEDEYTLPSAVPRRGVLFTISQRSPFFGGKARRSVADPENVQVAVLDRTTGRHKILIRGGTAAEYARSGHLLYAIAGTLFAARFDPTRLEMLGEPVPVVHDLQMALNAGPANYTVSHEGTLVYVPGTSGRRSLVWVDRNGDETPIPAPPSAFHYIRLSPDGTRAALEIREEQDFFVWDFKQQAMTRLTFDPGMDGFPDWTPDGRRILFSSTRDGLANLYAQTADGTGAVQRLTTSDAAQFVNSVSPDGAYVLVSQWTAKSGYDIFLFPFAALVQRSGVSSAPGMNHSSIAQALVQSPSTDHGAVILPDGRFFAYLSHESGRPEIYVRPFPRASEGRWQVSINGGTAPKWDPSGRELFYLSSANTLMSVAVQPSETTFRAGTPTKLLEAKYAAPGEYGIYDVSPDGRRFLMMKETDVYEPTSAPANMIVVLNWFEELRSRDQD